jgi:hypothetical protein
VEAGEVDRVRLQGPEPASEAHLRCDDKGRNALYENDEGRALPPASGMRESIKWENQNQSRRPPSLVAGGSSR